MTGHREGARGTRSGKGAGDEVGERGGDESGQGPGVWRTGSRRGIMGRVTDRAAVSRWLAGYEGAWRAAGTDGLAGLFAGDAIYLQSPYQEPVRGLDAIGQMWDDERDGPDEVFTLATEVLAVDDPVAVVRAEVRYGDPVRQDYRDLWVIRFGEDGRCTWFEEWPFWPGRSYAAGG